MLSNLVIILQLLNAYRAAAEARAAQTDQIAAAIERRRRPGAP
jgi:hypothetical protein